MDDPIVLSDVEECPVDIYGRYLQDGEQNDAFELEDDIDEEHQKHPEGKQPRRTIDQFKSQTDVQYAIDDVPPWYTTILMALQHFLLTFGLLLGMPLVLSAPLCVHTSLALTELIGTFFFVSGIVTLFQSTFGVRLPIIQGGTVSFLLPTFAILDVRGPCIEFNTANSTAEEEEAEVFWHGRIREIQGVIIIASLVQVLLGATGMIGVLLRFIGPLTIAPTIGLIGLSLFGVAEQRMATHWGISFLTVFLIGLFSQILNKYQLPLPGNRKFPIFTLFSIIMAIAISWTLCGILTLCDVFPNDPDAYGYLARTDVGLEALEQSSWFRVPYPFQWGTPTVSFAGVLGMLAGVIASVIESIGDYYACARLSGAPPPPPHAVNRGIAMEGVGCILAGIWGTGNGTTSYSQNVGAIGLTKVGSRAVIQVAGLMLITVGVAGKLNAVFSTMPTPVIGGFLAVTFGMVASVGFSNLQYIDLNSSRNLFILGLSFYLGISIPHYIRSEEDAVRTGSDILDQIITVLLRTGMFVGGATGMILDNVLRGTPEERGILKWKQLFGQQEHSLSAEEKQELYKSYEVPFITPKLRKLRWCQFVPISPTFDGFQALRRHEQNTE